VRHLELGELDLEVLEEEDELLAHVLLGPVPGTPLHQPVEDVPQVTLTDTLSILTEKLVN